GNITLQVDATDSGISGSYLIVSSDATFDASYAFYEMTDGAVTLNSDQLADGSYFTFGAVYSVQTEAELLHAVVNPTEDTIELLFDYPVAVNSLTGFEMTMG